ncbi:hypothetical protein M513_02819 [Trichuris suis]|uniref:DDE-1 domain-containing protein n=1 Tax=Trichuris suis TaxID=68888 RepID=A0A085MGL8_9BILA|nr:hypothetical protein M513_02819 [Trichuris suis]
MDQGIIEILKRLWQKQLLRHLLLSGSNDTKTVMNFQKRKTLKDCCNMVEEGWDSTKQSTFRSSWNTLIDRKENKSFSSASINEETAEVLETMKALVISNEYDNSNIETWLLCDSEDMGFQILSDDEIIKSIMKLEVAEDDKTEADVCLSHNKATWCLEIALQWFEGNASAIQKGFCALKVSAT